MHALITGATGFIGGRLCEKLIREGHIVRALVRDGRQCAPLEQQGIETALGNLHDPAALKTATAGIDVVYGLKPQTPTTEISPRVPIHADLYQASKLAAEERVARYQSEGHAATTVLHCIEEGSTSFASRALSIIPGPSTSSALIRKLSFQRAEGEPLPGIAATT